MEFKVYNCDTEEFEELSFKNEQEADKYRDKLDKKIARELKDDDEWHVLTVIVGGLVELINYCPAHTTISASSHGDISGEWYYCRYSNCICDTANEVGW